jgi:hypothetical protein
MGWVGNAVEKISAPITEILQPIEKGINQGVSDITKDVSRELTNVGQTIANSPVLEGAITAIAAYYGVPPSITAGFLAANKTSQTGGNLEKGLETFILSYGAGKFLQPGAIDLSTPEAIQKSAQTAQQASVSNAGQNATLERFLGPTGDFPLNGPELSKLTGVSPTIPTVAPAATTSGLLSGASTIPSLTPAAIESLVGSAGYGVNAAAAAAAPTLGIPLATVGAGALSGFGGVTPALTPAAIESGLGTAGYGVNAAATQSGLFTNPAIIGSGALVGAPSMNAAQTLIGPGVSAANTTGGLLSGAETIATPAAVTPAAISANQAIAAGMSPGALGATTAVTGGLTAAQLAAASGTVGAGSALEGLATLGNTSALTNLLSQGSSIGSTLSNLFPSASTVSSFLPSLITGGLQGLGAANTAEKAREAAQIQADAQIKAAQIAADAAKFRPVGVTTRFGASNFTTDAQGNVIGAGYTASPEIKAYQDRLSALAAQGLTGAEGAQAAYAPLTAGAQSLFNLGQGYLQQTPEQQAAAYIAKQQALLAPGQEQQLAQLQAKLQAQGRGGLSVAQGGNLAATSPELAAYYNALAQSNLQLAAQGQQAGQQQAQFGAGLLGAGSDLMGKYYGGQTAAYSPFATAIDTTTGLESLAQQPLTLGTQIGAKTTASAAEAGRLLGQGMINSAATQAPANAFSQSGNILGQFGSNPQLLNALNTSFGVTDPNQVAMQALIKKIYGV